MNNLSFDTLPQAVADLQKSMNEIKQLLQKENTPQPKPEALLTVPQAAKFLSLSVPTIYGKISRGELPAIKKSKRVYFSSLELMAYMKAGRKKTVSEIGSETDTFLSKRKGGQAK